MTTTLTAHMFNRTIVTEHATGAEAFDRVLDIALAQSCRIDGGRDAGRFIPRVWAGERLVDDPRTEALGSYEVEAVAR